MCVFLCLRVFTCVSVQFARVRVCQAGCVDCLCAVGATLEHPHPVKERTVNINGQRSPVSHPDVSHCGHSMIFMKNSSIH